MKKEMIEGKMYDIGHILKYNGVTCLWYKLSQAKKQGNKLIKSGEIKSFEIVNDNNCFFLNVVRG